jgi:sodium/proline symporter
MSTADSQLLAASSSVSHDLMCGLMGKQLDAKQKMTIARASLAVIAVFGMFLARDPNSSVFTIVSFAWAGFGASFGPAMLCALFWKRTTWQGALAGMLSGGDATHDYIHPNDVGSATMAAVFAEAIAKAIGLR